MPSEGALFRQVLAERWQDLHPDIQARFAKDPLPGKPLFYRGELSELYCSPLGKCLAYLLRPLIGGALIPVTDSQVPVDIQVYCLPDCPRVFKQRLYRLNARAPVSFTSYMAEGPAGEVLEYVGAGLGMELALDIRQQNLHFVSQGYFWQLGSKRIRLPDWLSPGKTFLCHANDAPNQFNIRIEIQHPWFGLMFRQVGIFYQIEQGADIHADHA